MKKKELFYKLPLLTFFVFVLIDLHGQEVTVNIDTTETYQQILGWGTDLFVETAERYVPTLQENLVELVTNHLGCNAYRWEISRRDWEDYANDNDDPDEINWDAFKTTYCDEQARDVVLPMKALVEARGEKFTVYSSSSFFTESESGPIPEWMYQSPAELSEWLVAHLLYVKNRYGITIDHICVSNEPDNYNRFNAEKIGNVIKYLGPRLKREGLSTSIMYPEQASVNGALDYIKLWQDHPEVMDYVSLFSYHLYFETSYHRSEKRQIYNIAKAKNIPVAQTESMYVDFNNLYDDLVNGGVSYWYVYWEGDYYKINPSHTSYVLKQNYWDIRQVLKYVKQGSYRTQAVSSDPEKAKVLAFKKDGDVVAVCYNPSDKNMDFHVRGLPSGYYAINKGKEELGIYQVEESGVLTVNLLKGEIATIFPTKGKNQPPLVTEWYANPSYLTLPKSNTTLNVTVSDQEKDDLTYNWIVEKQPRGAQVEIDNRHSANASAKGLTMDGLYEFSVVISDGVNTIKQKLVPVMVVSENQAPEILYLSHRKPILLQLPGAVYTTTNCWAMDRDGDAVSYLWSIASQPQGADIQLTNAQRKCEIKNMTVAGDYYIKLEASDSTHTSADMLKISVLPPNSAPVISTISASRPVKKQQHFEVTLSASASDDDGDNLGYWWNISSQPEGSRVVFAHQGKQVSTASGLNTPGTYIFTFVAADNVSRVSKEVSVTIL